MSLRLHPGTITAALSPIRPIRDEVAERIAAWTEILDRWSKAQRLVGWRKGPDLLEKGICDVWRARAALGDVGFDAAVDVGSGAGLPGLILAADLLDRPFHLVESRRKRAAFLREAARAMGLSQVHVHHARSAEARAAVEPSGSLLFVSRAFAAPGDAVTEAEAWNATLVLVSSSAAKFEAEAQWPPEGWTAAHGNLRRENGADLHDLLLRIAD